MSLITRCPACGTMFKVVPDQLRISDGWVRCGHCAEIFDGPAHFHDPNAAPPPAEIPQAPAFVPDTASGEAQAGTYDNNAGFAAPLQDPPWNPEPAPWAPTEMVSSDTTEGQFAQHIEAATGAADLPMDSVDIVFDDAVALSGQPDPATLEALELPIAAPSAAEPQVTAEAASAATPGFVRQADRKAFWRRPRVRGLLVLLLVVLLAALAVQAGVQERDRIAAQWPQARPLLVQLCEVAGCEVGPLRKIDSITIDGSSFTRLRPDAYRLSLNLKNNAAVDLAMPSVELTLTDTQDQSVIRRVLSPADMGASGTLAAGAEWNGAVPISVTAAGGASRVAGYRVLAFYP